jgi:class 3 adenylate cyclase/tetratricopeptide (TPR) repeat protein
MQCPACHSDNREGVRFCEECGAKFEIECPTCKALIPLGKKFCGACGNKIIAPEKPPDIEYDRPLTYTPKFLADKILTHRGSLEGERKRVTVLFADVADFTKLSEKLDPEQVHEIMDGCFKILMDAIHKHEGTINQFTGDGVMALFGAPVAHEDHAQRACHAALSVQQALGRFSEKVCGDYGIEFKMRIGLNSGPVIVGAIGDDLRMDYTAVGDTTNLAARMESLTRPGTVLISTNTQRLVKDYFELKALGKVQVKGKEEPQEAYELVGAGGVATRIEAAAAKGLTRFVGRKNSMAALMEAYEKVKGGTGQVVGVVGEAGVGKSRLLLEFRRRLPRGAFGYLEGRCIHFGSAMPYLPILDILKSYFEITENESEPATRKRVSEKILGLDEKLQGTLSPIFDLLSLKVHDETYLRLDPRVKQEKLFEALRDLIVRGSQERPLVLAVEDLHWIDKTTEEFLDYFIGWLPTTKVMLILLYRPEYTHQWAGKSYFSRIGVSQLTLKSSAELVKAILEGGETDPELSGLILNRAAGNPLFMEELTHSLLENGSIEIKDKRYVLCCSPADLKVPDTVQGIIAARIDRLEESLKKIMQVASVIGRKFAFRLLQAISGMREDLKYQLLNLQGLELIYEKSLFPELEYIFKHALVQEVAYNSLLSARRKEIHQRIGIAIETLYAGNLEEFYEMLAYHYLKAANHTKAYQYLVKSGDSASRRYAYAESRLHYARALEALAKLPATIENRQQNVDILIKQVSSSWRAISLEQSLPRLMEAQRLAKELPSPDGKSGGDRLRLARIHYWLGRVHYIANKMPEAIGYFRQVIEQAQDLDEPELLVTPSLTIGGIRFVQGHLDKAKAALSQSIPAAEKMGNWQDWCRAVSYHGSALSMSGSGVAGVAEVQRAVARAEEIGSLGEIALTNFFLSLAFNFSGEFANAIEAGRKAVEAGEASKERIYVCLGHAWKGWAEARAGDFKAAKTSMARSQLVLDELGGRIIAADWMAAINAEVAFGQGRIEEAMRLAERAIAIAQKMGGIGAEGLARRILGQAFAALAPPHWVEAEEQLKKSLHLLNSGQNLIEVANTHLAWGHVCLDRGNLTAAREHWEQAAVQFKASNLHLNLERINALLADLESKSRT